jgi:hypothetical protein
MHIVGDMRVTLDGVNLVVPKASLRAALGAAIEAAEAQGAIIVEVRGDGQPISDDLLSEPPDDRAVFELIELSSANPKRLVSKTLRDAAEALDQLAQDQQSAFQLIQQGHISEGLQSLQGVFSLWDMVRDVVLRGSQVTGIDLVNLESLPGIVDKQPMKLCLAALAQSLRELKSAVDSEDWSRVGDIVGYGLDSLQRNWRAVLTALAEYVESTIRAGRGGGGG